MGLAPSSRAAVSVPCGFAARTATSGRITVFLCCCCPGLTWGSPRIFACQIASAVIIHLSPSLAPIGYGYTMPLRGLSFGCGYISGRLLPGRSPSIFYVVYGSQLRRVPWFFLPCHVQGFLVCNWNLWKERDSNPRNVTARHVSDVPSTTRPSSPKNQPILTHQLIEKRF